MYEGLVRKSGNMSGAGGAAAIPGIVTTTGPAATDILHTVPPGRSFFVTKIMWYQILGANVTLLLGTLNNAAPPTLIQVFPTQLALNGMPGGLLEEEIPAYEFMLNSQATPNGWTGSLYVTSSVAGVLILVEVAEKG